MKKYLHFVLVAVCVLIASSCKDESNENDIEKELYKTEQEQAFLAMEVAPGFVKWFSQAGDGFVFAKQLRKGDGKRAYFNSRVSVYYKGTLTDGTVFDQRELLDGVPLKCAVNANYANYNSTTGAGYMSVISGWGVALQNMVEGDKYEVWIPQQLGYGAIDKTEIPAYSTLIFEIDLVSVDEEAVQI